MGTVPDQRRGPNWSWGSHGHGRRSGQIMSNLKLNIVFFSIIETRYLKVMLQKNN